MSGACGTHEGGETRMQSSGGNTCERKRPLEILGVTGWIILKGILKKYV